MNNKTVRKLTPALIGMGALLIYIVACTSFSPDDSKVLYITMDAKSGMTASAVYDRKTAQSELLFEPISLDTTSLKAAPAMMRPQWLNDGHDVLATWMVDADSSGPTMNLVVLPFDRRAPARSFQLKEKSKDNSMWVYLWPVPVAGTAAFLNDESNVVIRLDLGTGEMRRWTNQDELIVLPSPDNNHLFYLSGLDVSKSPGECGLLNPETFARTPLFKLTDTNISTMSLALSRDARRFAYLAENETPPVVHVLGAGEPPRTIPIASLGTNIEVIIRQFSPKGDVLYGSFKGSPDTNHDAYGFVEIPIDGSPVRKTTLISGTDSGNNELFASFQIDISHDGKTLAVESLWLGLGDHPIKADDCALFLVDLSDPQRKITKVPIPLPSTDRPSPFK